MLRARRCAGPAWLFVVALFLVTALNSSAWGCRLLDPPAGRSDTLWVHLEGLCLSTDRHQWAIKGVEVLDALKAGKSLDFQGALVVGDVLLDQLPLDCPVPIILAGGVGNWMHMASGLADPRVDAVATAHLFNFIGDGLQRARELLLEEGIELAIWPAIEDALLNDGDTSQVGLS